MPIYEYTCLSCGVQFEILRPMKEADQPATCTHCNSIETKRGLSTCFTHSGGASATGKGSCTGCSGGSCSSCGTH